jgi:hypothetical protein
MFPYRPRHAICGPSHGPSFGLFPRHHWYRQRENGTTPYTCERFLVSGLGTPNPHHVATTWPTRGIKAALQKKSLATKPTPANMTLYALYELPVA